MEIYGTLTTYGKKKQYGQKTYGEYMQTHSEKLMVKKNKSGETKYAETGGKHVNLSMEK